MNNQNITVDEVMLPPSEVPLITPSTIIKEALEAMDHFRLGVCCIVDEDNKLVGILTDGDIRRKLLSVQRPFPAFFNEDAITYAIKSPVTAKSGGRLLEAVNLMGDKRIWDLPVVESDNQLVGLLHLHPALKTLLNN